MVRIDTTDVCPDLINYYSRDTFYQIIQNSDDLTWNCSQINLSELSRDVWTNTTQVLGKLRRNGIFATILHKFNRNKILVNIGHRKLSSGAGWGNEYLITLDRGNVIESKKSANWMVGWEGLSYDYQLHCFKCNSEMKMKKVNDKYFMKCTYEPLCGNEYMTRVDHSTLFNRHQKY
tara:strand:- start:532 stop:1059 length:528 start_codon:yes stop_codon:yes gene_type:complete